MQHMGGLATAGELLLELLVLHLEPQDYQECLCSIIKLHHPIHLIQKRILVLMFIMEAVVVVVIVIVADLKHRLDPIPVVIEKRKLQLVVVDVLRVQPTKTIRYLLRL